MNYFFTQAAATDSDEDFAFLMNTFEKVKDHNMVGEICFCGATTLNSYEKICTLLSYAKKRAITDSDTIDRLLQASYVLATYRLMEGPENANFSSDSPWQNFVSGVSGEGEWHELFIYTLESGFIKEARILWNRHFASIAPCFCNADNEDITEANLTNFFRVLRAAILKDIDCWRDVIAFLEFDFVQNCLSKMTKQAELAYVGCLLRADASGQGSRLKELDRYSANLKMIDRLKTVYNCPLSYSTYVGLNSEQICYQILQQSVQNPNLMKKNVEKYARKFMAEHNLEPDETLYRYVEASECFPTKAESSRSRGVVGAASAWNDQCLLVSETIANLSIRCKAICMIAKGSRPPWSRRLSEAVQSVLKNAQVDHDIKKSLEMICRRAELGEMLMSYLISIGMLDSILATEYNFIKLIRFMFTHERYSVAQRLVDAVKELSVTHFLEEVRGDKGDQFLHDLGSRLVDGWIREIDSAVCIWTEAAITKRRSLLISANSVILRFLGHDDKYMQLYERLRSIEKLQETYNMYVSTAQLESKDWRDATLKRFIERDERSLIDIFTFSRILGMSRDEASRLAIKLAIDSGNPVGALTIMNGYVDIFLQVVRQCMLDDTTSDSSSEKEQSKSKDEAVLDERSRIYGVRRRVGVYQMRNEGPLFARMEAIAHIAAVAQSAVGTDKLESETRVALHSDQATRWNDLFNFLSLSNQDLLEYQARVYATSLPWWREVEARHDVGLRTSVRNICLRVLQAHPCDLWTPCTLLSSLPPATIEEVVVELRNVVSNRKSPQTMMNFLRVVQFAMILTGNTAPAKLLTDTFIKTLWAKRLGKACLPPTLPRKPIDAAIAEFAKHKTDPNIVAEYVDEFCGVNELPAQLLNYAIALVQLASASEEQLEIVSFLEVAHQALKVNEVCILPEKSFAAFRDVLYTVSPYNYPILNFVSERRRENTICKDELVWFTNREKQMEVNRKDPNIDDFAAHCRGFFENGTRATSFCTSSDSFSEENKEHNLYERDVLVVTMPQMAKQRLPFHPFLYLATSDLERFLAPVVEKELDIYNVICWQAMLRSVAWLRSSTHFTRSQLLSVAVGKISADVIAKGQSLSPNELAAIKQLLEQTKSRNAVVNCVSMCFKKLPLCETKILLLEMGRDVAQQWLTIPDTEQPLEELERIAIEEQVSRLSEAIEKYYTELILKRNLRVEYLTVFAFINVLEIRRVELQLNLYSSKSGLYNEKTCDLIGSPAELIGYLYSNCVQWKCEKEREQTMAVIEQLAKANHLNNLESVQEELVMSWLIADKADDVYAVDPNDTMGNADVGVGMSSADENEVFLLPFFDVEVDRIVHVLKLVNMEKLMRNLITYLRRDPSTVAGGYRTIVRAACVLLRAYNEQQLKQANYSQVKICVDLDAVLYGRLLELAHVDIPLDTFRRQEKSVVVRSLVAPGVRWTPQLTFLVASLIVDNEIADRSVVEVVLNRLQAAQKREMFVTLLSFCRQEKKLHKVKNLAMLWARAADWSLGSIENVTPELRDEFERWFYFAISCPVEGGRAFDSIRNALRARNYVVAAHLIAVVASYSQITVVLVCLVLPLSIHICVWVSGAACCADEMAAWAELSFWRPRRQDPGNVHSDDCDRFWAHRGTERQTDGVAACLGFRRGTYGCTLRVPCHLHELEQ
ncbi:unnamed protein product [Heligmosomoides polygyrus]|uniref:Rod_C domain-containing protein n=1 Tax=Heligmosomoides polygyrus TaxID=6339 RepID=A0A3P7YJF5_HELPZ|nr:unnamed protein product [Heligmosomoides polygyrus]